MSTPKGILSNTPTVRTIESETHVGISCGECGAGASTCWSVPLSKEAREAALRLLSFSCSHVKVVNGMATPIELVDKPPPAPLQPLTDKEKRYSLEEQCPDCRGEESVFGPGDNRTSYCICGPLGDCPRCGKILAGGGKQAFADVLAKHLCPKERKPLTDEEIAELRKAMARVGVNNRETGKVPPTGHRPGCERAALIGAK